MRSRKALFILSLLVALVFYAVFFAVAPRVTMLSSNIALGAVEARFRVELSDTVSAQAPSAGRADAESRLASRPGAVRDMLAMDDALLAPEAIRKQEPADVPDLEKRAAADRLAREHDLRPDPDVLKRVDTKIIEIAESAARKDINVVRRLVRPGADRVLAPAEMPVLRSGLAAPETVLRFDHAARSLLAEDAGRQSGESAPPQPEKPAFESGVLHPEEKTGNAPALPAEAIVAHAPVQEEAESARQESGWSFMDDLVEIKLDTWVPGPGGEGYFRLRILPKDGSEMAVMPKDVTFVVDASSSIADQKLRLTVRGVTDAIDRLRPEDYFNIVLFRDTPARFQPERVPATPENRSAAREFLSEAEPRGETDVYKGILPVVQEAPREGLPGVVMVISDGRPTTGIQDSRSIINGLTADNNRRHSIYAFGGGRTVNTPLLDLLAYRNKGEAKVIHHIAGINEALPVFFAQFNDPLLIDITTDYGRIRDDEVYPRIMPDFYRGQPLTVFGRFDPGRDGNFVMRLTGKALNQEKEVIFRANLEEAERGDGAIARGWAFQKAYHLIGRISQEGEQPELLAELRRLRDEYGIHTSYSYDE
jgi:hypothetical protein